MLRGASASTVTWSGLHVAACSPTCRSLFPSGDLFNSTGSTPPFSASNPFSATGNFAANPSANAQAKNVTPYTEQYNLAVEHQVR